MGFPIRANIFRANSAPQQYIRRFPIQVAVLFSPTDQDFTPAFRDIFLHLDQLTGDLVAFFAVLDPPADWRAAAEQRSWWQEHRQQVGELGFSFDERPLVSEIGRRFGVEWWELPVIVVSPNLWAAEYIVAPTSAGSIEQQLTALTDLAGFWGRPDINQIIELFENELGADVRYMPPNFTNRESFFDFYDVLGSFDPERDRLVNRQVFNRQVQQIQQQVQGRRNPIEFSRLSGQEPGLQEDNLLFNQAATETAGRIIPLATVAERVFKRLSEQHFQASVEALDEASIAMVETSLRVGWFLEVMERGDFPGMRPMRFGDRQRDSKGGETDFSPGAMGIWKMIELETNMSLIQAGRQACGIKMPQFFTLHDPDFPQEDAIIDTGNNHRADLNTLDRRHRPRHAFFTLGKSWHVVDSLLKQTEKGYDEVLTTILGNSLPNIVLEDWKGLLRIRNRASHIEPITRSDYQKVLNMGLNGKFLDPLMRVKQTLMVEK